MNTDSAQSASEMSPEMLLAAMLGEGEIPDADAAVIRFAFQGYAEQLAKRPTAPIKTVSRGNLPATERKARKGKKGEKSDKPAKEPSERKMTVAEECAKVFPVDCMEPGTFEPEEFLRMLQDAGKRPARDSEGKLVYYTDETGATKIGADGEPVVKMVIDSVAERADIRFAIAGYCGLTSEPQGVQLDRARREAKRGHIFDSKGKPLPRGIEIDYAPFRDPQAHADKWSVEAYVAGLPNHYLALLGDLEARERLAVDEVITFQNLLDSFGADPKSTDPRERARARKYAEIVRREFPDGAEAYSEMVPKLDRKGSPVTDDNGAPVLVEKKMARRVDHPIAAALKTVQNVPALLSGLLRIAHERTEVIRADLDALESNLSPQSIAQAREIIMSRGAPVFETPLADLVSMMARE